MKIRLRGVICTCTNDRATLLLHVAESKGPVRWECPRPIESVRPVFNSTRHIVVYDGRKLYILEVASITSGGCPHLTENCSVTLAPSPDPSPAPLVCLSGERFYFQDGTTGVRVVGSGGMAGESLRKDLVGFDERTGQILLRCESGGDIEREGGDAISHSGVIAIRGIFPRWLTIVSDSEVVIATASRKVMVVRDSRIISCYRLAHDVNYLVYNAAEPDTPEQPVTVMCCHGNQGHMTALTLPILGIWEGLDTVQGAWDLITARNDSAAQNEDSNPVLVQLVKSCENHVSQELASLNELYEQYDAKVAFFRELWRELSDATRHNTITINTAPRHNTITSEPSPSEALSPESQVGKRCRQDSHVNLDIDGFPVCIPYQFPSPTASPLCSKTSLFVRDGEIIVVVGARKVPIRGLPNTPVRTLELPSPESQQLYCVEFGRREWGEALRRNFLTALKNHGESRIKMDNYARVAFLFSKLRLGD